MTESFQAFLSLALATMLQSEECKRAGVTTATDANIEALVVRALNLVCTRATRARGPTDFWTLACAGGCFC